MRPERGTPAALDAEEGLLACCILDDKGEIFAACLEAKITPDYFFKPAHQVIYEACKRLSDKGMPIDEIILAHELATVPDRLEAVGGHAEINRLINRVETTAHFRHWLEIVREKAILRKCIAIGTTLVEKAHTGSYDPATLLEYQEGQFAALLAALKPDGDAPKTKSAAQQRKVDKLLARVKLHSFDLANRPPPEVPLMHLNGCEVVWRNNLTVFLGQKKSAKSSAQAAAEASLMGQLGRDYLGFSGRNPDGGAVIHFDTEQSAYDHDAMVRRMMRRAGLTVLPPWYHSVHLRPFSISERREIMREMVLRHHTQGGVAAVFLDGGADLVKSVNDEHEAVELVTEILQLMDQTKCGFVVSIHQNEQAKGQYASTNNRARGHLGAEFERKASMTLEVSKKTSETTGKEEVTIKAKDARHGKPVETVFAWSAEHEMHMTLSAGLSAPAEDPKTAQTRRELAILCAEIFSAPDSLEEIKPMSYMELVAAIIRLRKVSDSAAKRQATKLLDLQIIEKLATSHTYRPASGEKNVDSSHEF